MCCPVLEDLCEDVAFGEPGYVQDRVAVYLVVLVSLIPLLLVGTFQNRSMNRKTNPSS